MREKVMKNTASFILISLLLASIFAGAVSGAGVGVGGVEENENLDQEEKGNDGVGNANVTAASSITCNSCEDCTNKLNGKYDTVILTRDLINVKGSCITFGANNVVFNGNGHKIDGDDTGEFESGITMSSKSGNTIKNCVITDFESGITLYGSSKNKIYNNEVSSNYYDGIWLSANSDLNNIHDNLIENNGNYGIYFSSNSNGNTFSKNTVCSNPTDIRDVDKNSGDENTCDTTSNWNDDGTKGCTYSCPIEMPDLKITDIICDSVNHRIGYKIKNVGDATASKGHYTTLFVDGAYKIKEQVNVNLAPGAVAQRYFDYYSWQCTPPQDNVKVCADYGDFVDESNEKNNCREETCECAPPEKPDLVITDVWNEDSTICYQVRNIGNATVPKGHYTALSIDGEPVVNDLVDVELAPKERLKQCFNYAWQCSPPDDTLTVCADYKDVVDEASEGNNCRNETWKCDNTPPVIVSGPVVSEVTQSSVTISWTTNEDSDSLVRFGRTAGKYEDQKSSLKMKQEHTIILKDLLPSTTYRYVVQSTDASENTVVSRDGLFETSPLPDDEPPVVHALDITRGKGDFLYYELSADVSDNIGVERVEFYLDGMFIGTDYSAPYQCYMHPASVGMVREDFFREHTVETTVYDSGTCHSTLQRVFDPPDECRWISIDFEYPYPDRTLYTDGDVVPDGTTVPIKVYAAVHTQDIGYDLMGGHFAMEEISAVSMVEFYVNSVLICTDYPPSNDEYFNHVYTCDWDASGLHPWDFIILVKAIASEDCERTVRRDVVIEHGEPSLDVTREVTRTGNCFQVALTVENCGTASVQLDKIEDNVDGFQPIRKRDNTYEVTAQTSNSGRGYDIEIDLFTETGGDTITLSPGGLGGHFTVEYLAMPVLYPDSDPVEYAIGEDDVTVHHSDGSTDSFDRPCVLTTGDEVLSSSVDATVELSDYLIVTHPGRLFAQYNANDVNELLSAMAELAQLKQGIPGYVSSANSEDVRNQIRSWGGRMRGCDGIDNHYSSNGYLLLVGETEIIGSWEWEDAHYTDLPYANTANEWRSPELIVGRIIGNDASELIIPIQTSINVYKGEPGFEWDRSHALAVSGGGKGANSFERNVDDVADILDDEFSVLKRKMQDVGDITAEFKAHDANRDVIFFRDHGWPTAWSGVIGTGDFGGANPVDFEDSKPFAFACCCWAGRYEDEDISDPPDGIPEGENGIAETFLQHGTAVYIGATEKSKRNRNNVAAEKFLEDWWVGSSDSIGLAFRNFKRDFNSRPGRRYWIAEYNLYGDPKYGSASTVAAAASTSKMATSEPQRSLEIVIPDYNVTTTLENEHYVKIPGGDTILELDKPMVPFYTTNLDYPAGYRVQDVILTDRSGMTTETGLNIPNETMEWDSATIGALSSTSEEEWWPEEVFEWNVQENPDGTSTLIIVMYPFYYNHLTTDVVFYKNYKFEINYTSSTVEIAALRTDKDAYQQGDDILVNLWLNNSGNAQDVLVDSVVKAGSSGEIADGLLLRTLKEFEGIASFSPHWNSSGVDPGYYFVEVTLKDTGGNVLDRKTEMFRLGISSGEIASFTATPECFDTGDEIEIEMAFENTGTVNIAGTAVIRVLNSTGDAVEEFRHNVTNLTPSRSISFSDEWDTSGAEEGSYKILGYVLYDSKATSPATVIVTTVPLEKKPDLEIVKKWENWVDKEKGTYTVSYVVHNNGTTVAPAGHHTTLYIDEEAVEHTPVPVTLKPSDTYEDTFKTVVKCTPPGDKIMVCADNYDKVDELNEGNNCMTNVWQCPVPAKMPDLVIKDIKLTKMDGYCYVDYLITNTGTTSASASTTYLYVDGKKVASDSTGSLATGASRWDRFTYRATGTHTFKVCADGPNAISESNEANNCRTEKLTCPLSLDIYFADGRESPGSVYHYNTTTGIEETVYTRPSRRLYSFSFHPHIPEKLYYANANEYKIYRTLQTPSGWTPEEVVYTHTTYVRDIAFAFGKDGELRLYFSEATGAGENGKIYKIEDGKAYLYYEVKLADVGGSWGGDFAFDDKGNLYLSSGNQIPASIYKVEDGKVKEIFKDVKECISGLVYEDGALYYANFGTKIYRLDLTTGERTVVYSNPERMWLSDVGFRPELIG